MIAVVALFVAALITLIALGLASTVSWRYLWLAASSNWILSFLASFSIGLYTLVLSFVLFSLAIGFSAGWIKSATHELLAAATGVALWAIAIHTIDDFWLFLPISAPLHLLLR